MNKISINTVTFILLLGIASVSHAVPPAAPTDLQSVPRYGVGQGFVLTWSDTTGETGYRVERSVNGGAFGQIIEIGTANTVQYFDAFVPANIAHEVVYRVRAYNADGNSPYSNESQAMTLQVIWPAQDGTHSIYNGFADYTPGNLWRFHEGLDVQGNNSTIQNNQRVIVAIRGGRIHQIDDYAGGYIGVEIDVDGVMFYDRYLHMVHDGTLTKVAGDTVAAGEIVGRVNATRYAVGAQHLHLAHLNSYVWGNHGYAADASNMLNPLLLFSANADRDPQQMAPALEDYNGDGNTLIVVDKGNIATERDPVFGGVDIVAEAFDDMTTVLAYHQNVHSAGYWIESLTPNGNNVQSAATPYILTLFNDDWFGGDPPIRDKFFDVFDDTREGADGKSGYYIVTNAAGTTGDPGDIDADQFWRTNAALASGANANGSDHAVALVNDVARFDEGYYRIHIVLRDIVNPAVDSTEDVLVDNFLPYVKRVTAYSGSTLIYEARWEWDGMRLRLDPPDPNSGMFAVADRTQDIDLEIEFSEPVKNTPTVSVSPLAVSPTLTSIQPVNKRKIWHATIASVDIDNTGADDGVHYLTISALDLNDNPLLAISTPDPIDPTVSINRDGGGVFPATTGDDTLHRFRIGPVAGLQNVLLLTMKHPAFAEPGDTPAQKATAIQTLLNAYYPEVSWNTLSFSVTAPPNWIDLDHDPAHYYAVDSNPLIELVEESIAKAVAAGVSFTGVDRIMVLTNENADRGDQATTGYWPYTVPPSGSQMMSASVHTLSSTDAAITHGAGHHLGLVDLYDYPHVVTPRPFVGEWGHMSDRTNQPHFISWSKHRLGWITGSGNSEQQVAKPDVGSPISNLDYVISPLETDTNDRKVVIVEVADRLSYYIENRKPINLDSGLPDSGVLITKVNEYVEPGAGPAIVQDQTNDGVLNDATYNNGETFTDANVNLTISVLAPTGDNENIRIDYDPPSDRNDVYVIKQDGRWKTPDIWVDAPAAGGVFAADPESEDENPVVGVPNRVYCRYRNQGDAAATSFRVILEIREPWSTGQDFEVKQEKFVTVLPGETGKDFIYYDWTPTAGVHTCVKCRIVDVANDDNYDNNATQENIHEFDVPGGSPYESVETEFDIGNPYDEQILVYLRVDGLPQDWPMELTPSKALLGPKENLRATSRITPLESAPRCSREEVTITAYTPRGDTLVPLGAITQGLHLVNFQDINHQTDMRCRGQQDPKLTHREYDDGPQICTLVTRGCTNPPRPNEEILIVYTDPLGNPVVRTVTTDEYGCFDDYFTTGQAGIWETKAVIPGDDCNQRGESDPTDHYIPGEPDQVRQPGDWLMSFHFGGAFPQSRFANHYDSGFSLNVDAEWVYSRRLSYVAYYGFHQFYKETGNEYIQHLSANVKYYVPWLGWDWFAQAGFGWYDPESMSGDWGYNIGAGVQLSISQRLALEIGANYHKARTELDADWISAQMGILFELH